MPPAGATKTFSVLENVGEYNLIPTTVGMLLLADLVINPTGSPIVGMKYIFNYGGGVVYDGGTVTIFDRLLTQAEALAKYTITCTYIDGAWDVKLEFSDASSISGTYLADSTVTNAKLAGSITLAKLIASTRGYFMRAGVSGVWEAITGGTAGNILQYNGTDIVSNAVTGDITISGAGVTAIGAGKITAEMLAYTPMEYFEVNRTFSSAEVLTLYSSNTNTGIELLSAPGVGKYIELISVSAYNNYNTATYSAGANLLNLNVNGVALWTFPNAFIEATVDTPSQGTRVSDAIIALNTGIKVQIATADPTVGDGTITVSAIYRIKTV